MCLQMAVGSTTTLTASWMTRMIWVVGGQRRSQCLTPPLPTGLYHVTPANRFSRPTSPAQHLTLSRTQKICSVWTLTPPTHLGLLRRDWRVQPVTAISWTTCSPHNPTLHLQRIQKTWWAKVQQKICSLLTHTVNQHRQQIKVNRVYFFYGNRSYFSMCFSIVCLTIIWFLSQTSLTRLVWGQDLQGLICSVISWAQTAVTVGSKLRPQDPTPASLTSVSFAFLSKNKNRIGQYLLNHKSKFYSLLTWFYAWLINNMHKTSASSVSN